MWNGVRNDRKNMYKASRRFHQAQNKRICRKLATSYVYGYRTWFRSSLEWLWHTLWLLCRQRYSEKYCCWRFVSQAPQHEQMYLTNNRILKLNLVVQECKLMTIASMIFRQTTKIIPCRKGVFQFHGGSFPLKVIIIWVSIVLRSIHMHLYILL